MPPAIRCLPFVSGEKPDRSPKALAVGADLVCIDLEDAVAPACKQQAREGDQLKLEGIKVLDLSQFLSGPFWSAVVERLGIGYAHEARYLQEQGLEMLNIAGLGSGAGGHTSLPTSRMCRRRRCSRTA